MILDLADASPRTFFDALVMWDGPVFDSQTALAALYPSRRNITDERLREIAARTDIVGILAQRQFLGGDHLVDVARHAVHAVRIVGSSYIALGLTWGSSPKRS